MNNDNTKIIGIHKLSVCDLTIPGAKELQAQILEFATNTDRKIHLGVAKKHRFLADLAEFGSPDTPKANLEAINKKLRLLKEVKFDTLKQMYLELHKLALVRQYEVHNLIPTAGRAVFARWLTGDNTYDADLGANYGSLGTNNTTPANGDTQLGTEVYRKATSSVAQSSNIAYLSNFYTATEVAGTFEEAGWHIDGTATVNTGQLVSHFLTGSITKSAVESLTVESVITFS